MVKQLLLFFQQVENRLENLEINDGDVNCGHISREVMVGQCSLLVEHWELQ